MEFCSSDLSTSGYGTKINPLHQGHTKSPCKSRPETGAPCPIVGIDKNNSVCPCHLLTGKGPKLDVWQIAEMYARGEIRVAYTPQVVHAMPDLPCQFPGCERTTKGQYCRGCGKTVGHRRNRWIAEHGTQPSIAYLHQPKGSRLAGVKPEKERRRRADVYHGRACGKCGGTERYSSNGGCTACARQAMIKKNALQQAYKRQAVTIPAVWMYAE
jgi:hypothetical protein